MSKVGVIVRSEYLRRVTSRGFLLATVLAPVLVVGVIAAAVAVGVLAHETGARDLVVRDETGVLAGPLAEALPDRFRVVPTEEPADSLAARVRRGLLDGYVVLPTGLLHGDGEATLVSARGGGVTAQLVLEQALRAVVREARLREIGAPEEAFRVLGERVVLRSVVLTESGEAPDAAWLYTGLGYALGFLVYVAVFVYGAMVMRGVIEEKASRVVEVIVSSVRPGELMAGKVLGIGLAGLTQLAAWALLLAGGFAAAGPLVFLATGTAAGAPEAALQHLDVGALTWPPVSFFVAFLGYFLGGYLLYAGLFAAVGSAVETEADAQSLQVPVSIPVVLPVLCLPFVADDPGSALSVVLSLVPFFAPILMPVRIAAGAVPAWQVVASLVLLALAFAGALALAARIYRVGILRYGKRASLRDLARWVRQA